MKTDDLVAMLATGVTPVDRRASARRFGFALLAGAIGALILMEMAFGVRPDIGTVIHSPLFWAKLAFPFVLSIGALGAAARLSKPGRRPGWMWAVIAAPVALVWSFALYIVVTAAPDERLALVLGETWRVCPFNIAFLSVPAFIANQIAMRGLAPTAPRLAGAVGGLLSGSVATVAYSVHCPEMGVAFWAVWYVLGMLIPTALGALIGPRLLRW
ncbi:anti-sigma F factor [Trinickia dabaoshanensis]|uniref:Anti-sigma F factor n=1 Tax=Trinickia dabaoshanensis TaxID=564714 RepID=A0A2N7W3E4_9BURK|nr:DUF1109 domain-containing protein [Trinickia dabaoshanensis]PMS23928.1 anti-sigma F factor [Trinickia dabaoshanensis]